MGSLGAWSLPGIGRVEGRAPTLEEYELALAFLRGRFGDEPTGGARELVRGIERTLRRRRWADAVKGTADGNEDRNQLDGGHVESDPWLL